MIGRERKSFSSRIRRIACTRPSNMSEGATISAPAWACVRASRARRSIDSSLMISVPRTIPQCPWDVYSQRQTSVMTTRSGTSSFIALLVRNAEEDHRGDAEGVHLVAFADDLIDRHLERSGHRGDFLPDVRPRAGEEGINEVGFREFGFTDHRPENRGHPCPPKPFEIARAGLGLRGEM